MAHVMNWAKENKMTVNLLKTVELVFHRPNISHDLMPAAMPNVTRVMVAKLLGVLFRHDFNFSSHVDSVVSVCNQRSYSLGQLKRQGQVLCALDRIFQAIVNKSLYALTMYFANMTEGHKNMLRRVFTRASRCGFTLRLYDLELLAEKSQYHLFCESCRDSHCLKPFVHRQNKIGWCYAAKNPRT